MSDTERVPFQGLIQYSKDLVRHQSERNNSSAAYASDEICDRRSGHGGYKWQTDSQVMGDDDATNDISVDLQLETICPHVRRIVAIEYLD